jgi:hypothetical protein
MNIKDKHRVSLYRRAFLDTRSSEEILKELNEICADKKKMNKWIERKVKKNG